MENSTSHSSQRDELCCGSNGICSHEVLRDGESENGSKMGSDKYTRKVNFQNFGLIFPFLYLDVQTVLESILKGLKTKSIS